MPRGLTVGFGWFYSKPVDVVDKQGNILHFGSLLVENSENRCSNVHTVSTVCAVCTVKE